MNTRRQAILLLVLAPMTALAFAAESPHAKDVVLASLVPPASPAAGAARPDALAVSVLVEGPYGMLLPRPADAPFTSGERFRIKLLAPRDGEVLVYNTNPQGQTSPAPVWKAEVKGGIESVSELLQVTGNQGEDQLHVVLQPRERAANPFAWFQRLLAPRDGGSAGKDIRLVSESTAQGTYFYNTGGEGGYVTIRIRH